MKLNILEDVLTMPRSHIGELLACTKTDLQCGYVVDEFGNKGAIDVEKFEEVKATLEQALAIKSQH